MTPAPDRKKICIVGSPERSRNRTALALAELLAERHEVVFVDLCGGAERARAGESLRVVAPRPSPFLANLAFGSEEHRLSAAIMAAIESTYADGGPDYVEVFDRDGLGLVPLHARRAGHPLLRETLFGVRVGGSRELERLHDGTFRAPTAALEFDIEREQLRLADRLIWPGGDTLGVHRRYYGEEILPAAELIATPLPVEANVEADGGEDTESGGPLRLLYCASLRRSLGVLDLAEAVLRLPLDGWRLTIAGDDSRTAPASQSMRLQIERMFGEDPRLEFVPEPTLAQRRRLFDRHDLLVVPSRFEVWPEVAIEAVAAGLPVLATPVGFATELIEPGVNGRLVDELGPRPLRAALQELVEDPSTVRERRRGGGSRPALTEPGAIAAGYELLLSESPRASAPPDIAVRPSRASVTGIVPYFNAAPFVEEAVDSLLAQTHRDLDVIVVNDGSFTEDDAVLQRLAEKDRVQVVTQLNSGESAARNLAVCLAGGEYLMMLDADNALEPDFVERAAALLDAEPDLAYVTSWLRFIGPDGAAIDEPSGYAALGNGVVRSDARNLDGDTLALLPRRVFTELGYGYDEECVTHPDWALYRSLREDGHFGAVIPSPLARYRVVPDSLLRSYDEDLIDLGWSELKDKKVVSGTRWTVEAEDGR